MNGNVLTTVLSDGSLKDDHGRRGQGPRVHSPLDGWTHSSVQLRGGTRDFRMQDIVFEHALLRRLLLVA